MRLDSYLASFHQTSRNRVQFWIDSGLVCVNEVLIKKPSFSVSPSDSIVLHEDSRLEWVSRSAVKLDDFVERIGYDVFNHVCLDVGSSTGGFTQVLLKRGARSVTCVEVGTNQLHNTLRARSEVTLYEHMDIRDFAVQHNQCRYELIVGDVSWCKLRSILPSIIPLLAESGDMMILYKPQFECEKSDLKRSGIVRCPKTAYRELQDEILFWEATYLVRVCFLAESSLTGEAGNQEYMLHIRHA